MPTSLVHNWLQESEKFSPTLKLLNYTGGDRKQAPLDLAQHDVILTTYGVLRNDIESLQSIEFHYVILDEAQAMKNSSSQTAASVRQLKAQFRLGLSGTPIENHLGELWSIMSFVNPGLLWNRERFDQLYCSGRTKADDIDRLRRLVKPFILRRTKEEVLTELPAKTEQVILCEMDTKHKKFYNEIKNFYRMSILKLVDQKGMKNSKLQVLEGLLRLRQAACHPQLLKPDSDLKSSKLETLLHMLEETIDEGQKALVFSQFTSMLALIDAKVGQRKWSRAYLDGQTRKRQDQVKQFQDDPDCKLFLISLKAGGLGLNLTAASFVFIYDPWWNPAAEMQAIDRAYRMGQTKPVTAYRLIMKDTVEEKILELQSKKKDLVKAVISDESSIIKDLSMDDLKYLFS